MKKPLARHNNNNKNKMKKRNKKRIIYLALPYSLNCLLIAVSRCGCCRRIFLSVFVSFILSFLVSICSFISRAEPIFMYALVFYVFFNPMCLVNYLVSFLLLLFTLLVGLVFNVRTNDSLFLRSLYYIIIIE